MKFSKLLKIFSLLVISGIALPTQANVIVFESWLTNEGNSGNYILAIEHSNNEFNFDLRITPWNAEALGLFIDLGDVDLSSVGINSVSDLILTNSNNIVTYAIDSADHICGNGCNLNGLNPVLTTDEEWEMIFSLGATGFDDIQRFQLTTSDFGLELSDFKMIGIRSQQLCSDAALLDNGDEGCTGSDKSYSSTFTTTTTTQVPESNIFILLLLVMTILALIQKKPKEI